MMNKYKSLIQYIIPASVLLLVLGFFSCYIIVNSMSSIADSFSGETTVRESLSNIKESIDTPPEHISKASLNIWGEIQKAQKKDYIETTTYLLAKDQSGKFHRVTKKNGKLKERVDVISKFLNYNNKKGRETVYAAIPPSVVKNKIKLPKGVTDYGNQMTDEIIVDLNFKGIETIDLRPFFADYPIKDMYFSCDHHWKNDMARLAACYTAEDINKLFGLKVDKALDYADVTNYNTLLYKNSYSGSFNRIAGEAMFPKDSTSLDLPKWSASYTVKGFDSNGKLKQTYANKDFLGAFINKSYFNSYNSTINAFLHGYTGQSVIYNNLSDNQLKIVLISSSMGRPFVSYFSNYFKEIHYLECNNTNINVTEYIDKVDPDLVVMLYGANTLEKNSMFRFNGKK